MSLHLVHCKKVLPASYITRLFLLCSSLEWLTRMEAAMLEAAQQTERVRSRAGSVPRPSIYDGHHDTSGWQSPETIGDRDLYGSTGRVLSPTSPPPLPEIYHGGDTQSCRCSESSVETENEEASCAPAKDFQSSTASVTTTTNGSLENNEEDFEMERVRRCRGIFERMGKMLDTKSDSYDLYADGVRSNK